MKIVQIIGGLGNQMFQYALAVVLKERFQDEVRLDLNAFNGYPIFNGFVIDKVFVVDPIIAFKHDIRRVYWPFIRNYKYYRFYKHLPITLKTEFKEKRAEAFNPEVYKRDGNYYYDGYWQDYRYFFDYQKIVKESFRYRAPLNEKNADYTKRLMNNNSVSIHVRRGDYNKNPYFGGLCELDYYKKAISIAQDRFGRTATYAIFSNEIEWCKENIIPLLCYDKVEIIDWNKGAESFNDMRLMSCCRMNILANSSFSWWSAFLNNNDNPIVVAPKTWSRKRYCIRQLPEWILVPNE